MPSTQESVTQAVVRTRGLSVDYGRVRALHALDLEVGPGATGLLGPNGAGKTTLLRVLLGFVEPAGGAAAIAGWNPALRRERLELRRQVGYMPEGDCVFPIASGVDLVATLGRLGGLSAPDAMTRAHEALDYAGIDDARYREAATYSSGLKQRLKLAQALVHDPDLLLLDEPTSGLDPRGRSEMLGLIDDLAHAHGKTLLVCSHLLKDVERTCDRVLVLDRGRLAAGGTIADLRGVEGAVVRVTVDPEGARFAAALAARGLRAREEGQRSFLVTLESPEDDCDEIFGAAAEAEVALTHLETVRSTLEEVFLEVLRRGGEAAV